MIQLGTHQKIGKLWGHETIIINNNRYCGKVLTVEPNGKACSIHFHKLKTETFLVTRGKLTLQLWKANEERETISAFEYLGYIILESSESITIEPWTAHRFWSDNDVTDFVEFSSPDDPSDSYRLQSSGVKPIGLISRY